ncbi:MAG: hypothetical protein LBK98_01920 [Peptococcaceae bacterium]|jgi:hypothetical protein|nr:hypothetical protein [Peptococcaceae bacterium]
MICNYYGRYLSLCQAARLPRLARLRAARKDKKAVRQDFIDGEAGGSNSRAMRVLPSMALPIPFVLYGLISLLLRGDGALGTVINQWDMSANMYSEFESTSRYSIYCRKFISGHFIV